MSTRSERILHVSSRWQRWWRRWNKFELILPKSISFTSQQMDGTLHRSSARLKSRVVKLFISRIWFCFRTFCLIIGLLTWRSVKMCESSWHATCCWLFSYEVRSYKCDIQSGVWDMVPQQKLLHQHCRILDTHVHKASCCSFWRNFDYYRLSKTQELFIYRIATLKYRTNRSLAVPVLCCAKPIQLSDYEVTWSSKTSSPSAAMHRHWLDASCCILVRYY